MWRCSQSPPTDCIKRGALLTVNVLFLLLMLLYEESNFYGFNCDSLLFVLVSTIMMMVFPFTFVVVVVALTLSRSKVFIVIFMIYQLRSILGLGYLIWIEFVPTLPYIGYCSKFEIGGTSCTADKAALSQVYP